jgi:hypothetical protein
MSDSLISQAGLRTRRRIVLRKAMFAIAALGLLMFAGIAVPARAATTTTTVNDCPEAAGVLSAAINLPGTNPLYPLTVSFTHVANTFTYAVTTPSTDSGQGVTEYCVYPTDASGTPTGTIPAGTTESTTVVEAGHVWTAGTDCSSGCVDSIRSDGDPADIPYDGATTTALTVVWGTVPNFLIVLHILDGTICGGGTSNPGTCFVIPNTSTTTTSTTTTSTTTTSTTTTSTTTTSTTTPTTTATTTSTTTPTTTATTTSTTTSSTTTTTTQHGVPQFGAPAIFVAAAALLALSLVMRFKRPSLPNTSI